MEPCRSTYTWEVTSLDHSKGDSESNHSAEAVDALDTNGDGTPDEHDGGPGVSAALSGDRGPYKKMAGLDRVRIMFDGTSNSK